MNDDETLKEAVHSWFAEYFAEGRSKKQLISYLRGMPEAAHILIDEIIEHLENPRKEFLGKPTDINIELRDQEILSIFEHGPVGEFPLEDKRVYDEHPATGWKHKSYDEKIAEIAKLYPELKRSYLYKLISKLQNQ